MTTPVNNSRRMSQPWFMRGRGYRRDGVPEYVVDGDSWLAKAIDGDDAWALFCASADGDLDKARRLIDGDRSLVHAQIWYAKPIDVAMREGHFEMVKFFLEQGADKNPDVPDWAKPLTYAKDYLEDHATRYSEREHGQSRLNGHRTNQPVSAYEAIIQLLS